MKTTEKDAEEKRLQRNAYKRQWYARLSDGQKELARQKRRDKYAASKKILPIGRIACSRSTQTPQPYAHQNKGIVIKDMVDDELAGYGGNGATSFFLTFAMLSAVVEMIFKFAGGNHVRFARNDSSGATCASSLVVQAATVLSLRLARKQIEAGVHRS